MGKVKVAQLDYMFTFYLTLPRPIAKGQLPRTCMMVMHV